MDYPLLKSLHIVFVTSWFAGLFYLPRIFVNLAMVPADSVAERNRLLLMSHKLMRFTHMLSVFAILFGTWLWLGVGIGKGPGSGWLHVKLALVVVLVIYQGICVRHLKQFDQGTNPRSHVWYRWFNELPVLVLLAVVLLVVFKPF